MSIGRGWYIVIHDEETLKAALAWFKDHPGLIAGIELRLDLASDAARLPAPPVNLSVIVTDRGSRGNLTRATRRDEICRRWGGVLDVDRQTDATAPADLSWIYSCHRSVDASISVDQQIEEARQSGAMAAKIVMPMGDLPARRLALANARSQGSFPVVCFCAGNESPVDRLVALDRQQPWGYARTSSDDLQIPGLPTIEAIVERYRFLSLQPQRPLLAVIGASVENHLAPGWHNRWLERHRSPTRMIPFSSERPEGFLEPSESLEFTALSVCAPFQKWARQVAQPLDEDAARWDHWDTLIRQPDRSWMGTSCATIAAMNLLAKTISPDDSVVILGANEDSVMLAQELTRSVSSVSILRTPRISAAGLTEWCDDSKAIERAQVLIAVDRSTDTVTPWHQRTPWHQSGFKGRVVLETGNPVDRKDRLGTRVHQPPIIIDSLQFFAEQMRLQGQWFHRRDVSPEEALQITEEALKDLS
ncbi:MAG: hypothetical protein OSB09_01420 [Planctomycetota bacterium]|nr:hypothetical protein [Planctomycetota bacterium]